MLLIFVLDSDILKNTCVDVYTRYVVDGSLSDTASHLQLSGRPDMGCSELTL